jgi:hypothetical protein
LAAEYCLDLKGDLEELLFNVDKLVAIDTTADSWRSEIIASCKESFETKPFYPEVSELNSITIFYSVDELCDTYADTFASVIARYAKKAPKSENHPIEANLVKKNSIRSDFVKIVNIVPFQLYLAKQGQKLLKNCYNSVLLESLRDPTLYCGTTLPNKIDFSLWNDRLQQESCFQAFETFAEEAGDPYDMNNPKCQDPDSESCQPCNKIIGMVFD